MKINKKIFSPIIVEWLDAQTYVGWHNIEELINAEEDTVCVTRGFYCGQTKDYILVAHTVGKSNPAEGDVCGCIKIPKGMILRVK
jgi:hypothetical protein